MTALALIVTERTRYRVTSVSTCVTNTCAGAHYAATENPEAA